MQAFDLPRVAVIALAKRIEEVFVPGRPDPIVLDPHSPGLQLLQRIRDEAHRFALGFHRQRRDARSFESIFDDAAGRGARAAARDPPALRLAGAVPRRDAGGARGRAPARPGERPGKPPPPPQKAARASRGPGPPPPPPEKKPTQAPRGRGGAPAAPQGEPAGGAENLNHTHAGGGP